MKKSLYVLIRQIDIHDSKIQQQELDQLNFVVDQIRQMKKRIDDHFTQMKHKINDELKEMTKKLKKNMKKRFMIVK